jgi:3-demethylubiquinone-9 3-methyltransferase
MQKISPFLWFDHQAEEAANFYVSIFKDSKILKVSRYPEGSPGPAGSVMVVNFQIEGQNFMALNAGPLFKFTEAISFLIIRTAILVPQPAACASSSPPLPAFRSSERQIRLVVAGHSHHPGRIASREGSQESATRHASHARNEKDRHSSTKTRRARVNEAHKNIPGSKRS